MKEIILDSSLTVVVPKNYNLAEDAVNAYIAFKNKYNSDVQ